MDSQKQEKLKRFCNDTVMSEAVYSVLLRTFLKSQGDADVNVLAAERIAITLLDDAWKELWKFKNTDDFEPKKVVQVGL